MNLDKLAAKVRAVNQANAYAARLYAFLEPVFQPLIGQTILRKDGRILAKIGLKSFPKENGIVAVHQNHDKLHLSFTIDVCQSMVRHATIVKIGDLDGKVLVSMPYGNTLYKQYDFDTIRSACELAEKVENIYRYALRALSMYEVFI